MFLFRLKNYSLFLSREAFKEIQILTQNKSPVRMDNYFTLCHTSDLWRELKIFIIIFIFTRFVQHYKSEHTQTRISRQWTVRTGNAMYIVALFHNKRRKNIFFFFLGLLMLCCDTWIRWSLLKHNVQTGKWSNQKVTLSIMCLAFWIDGHCLHSQLWTLTG